MKMNTRIGAVAIAGVLFGGLASTADAQRFISSNSYYYGYPGYSYGYSYGYPSYSSYYSYRNPYRYTGSYRYSNPYRRHHSSRYDYGYDNRYGINPRYYPGYGYVYW